MSVDLEFGVLGPLEVTRRGQAVPLRAAKHRVLLAALLLRANQVVPVDELIERLWGHNPPGGPRGTLRAYVMRLRHALDTHAIETHPEGYLVRADRQSLDLHRFDDLTRQAKQAESSGDPATESELLRRALALWRGPMLSNVLSDSLHRDIVPGLAERRLDALQRRIDLDLRLGREQEITAELQGLTTEYPLRERFWAQLMLALYRSGRQGEALETYRRVRNLLGEELGIEPGAELRDLHQSILTSDPDLAAPPSTQNARPEASSPVFQLPPDVSNFVGRTDILEQIGRLISPADDRRATPIVTLTGQPGVGKTALAIHLAHRLRTEFPDGLLHLDLRGYSARAVMTANQALSHLLRMLGVRPDQILPEVEQQAVQYRSILAGKRMLVVLDNAATPEQVRWLLPAEPHSAVLITSRNELRGLTAMQGARPITVDVLRPEDSLQLLTDILGKDIVAAEPRATGELAALCAHLPLALRIAAANISGRRPARLAEYVAELHNGNRLAKLAVDDDEDAAVQMAFDLSYRTLKPEARRLFRLLGLVPGFDVTAAAAAALTGETPEETKRLLDHLGAANLVHSNTLDRYQFHGLLREYATQRAETECEPAERDAALRSLFDYYLRTADAATHMIRTEHMSMRLNRNPVDTSIFDDPQEATDWLDTEHANLLAAVHHAADHGPREISWHLTDALRAYLWRRLLHTDWIAAAEAGLRAARAEGDVAAEATMLLSLGTARRGTGDAQRAAEHLETAHTAFHEAKLPEGAIAALNNLANCHLQSGRIDRAVELFSRALRECQDHGHIQYLITVQVNLGAAYESFDLRRAGERSRQAFELAGRHELPHLQAISLNNLANTAAKTGHFHTALQYARQSHQLFSELANEHRLLVLLIDMARLHCERDELDQATEIAQDALQRCHTTGSRAREVDVLTVLGGVHQRLGDGCAIEHCANALRIAEKTGYTSGQINAHMGLATAYRDQGDFTQAREHANQALVLAHSAQQQVLEGHGRTLLASILHSSGQHHEAIQWAEAALGTHRVTGARLGEARTLHLFGLALQHREGSEAASPYLREASELFRSMGMREADEIAETLRRHDAS